MMLPRCLRPFSSGWIVALIMLSMGKLAAATRLSIFSNKQAYIRFPFTAQKFSSSSTALSSNVGGTSENNGVDNSKVLDTGDLLSQGLNGAQDISVKAVSCKEIVQECILKSDLSPIAAQALGELLVSALMMGSSLKGEETLQVHIVGNTGLQDMMVITDGKLQIRGRVGQTRFEYSPPSTATTPASNTAPSDKPIDTAFIVTGAVTGSELDATATASAKAQTGNIGGLPPTSVLLGEGQVQVVRNHPSWKQPMNGIVTLRDVSIPLNLALYMAESEQRPAALLTDVQVEGNLCRYALGVMVERLPGCTEDNIETSIANLQAVQRKGLRSYLDRTKQEKKQEEEQEQKQDNNNIRMFRSFEPVLDAILDDCMGEMDDGGFRWSKTPSYRCSCGVDRVWRTLRLLPKEEIEDIIKVNEDVQMKCEFCGTNYSLTAAEIKDVFSI